jgi:alpha-beta hydrolase superfamily lysophospholipase
MTKTKTAVRNILTWIFWIIIVQAVLANISAAIYAYKFTHFKEGSPPPPSSKNIITKTWKLFVGPTFYKQSINGIPNFPVEEVQLFTQDSILIKGWYSKNDSAKACVVLFHGYSANKSYALREAEQFKSRGYNILLIDFRNHGESSGSATSFGEKENEEVVAAFDYAKQQGNQKIILYGISMGAVSVMKAVAQDKIQPTAIIADMPFGSLQDHFKSRAKSIGFPSQPFAFLISTWIGIEQGYNPYTFKTCNYAKDIHCPVLLQWGEKDIYVKKEEIQSIYNCLASTSKKLVVYPEANHESFLNVDPSTWQKEVQYFIDALK